MTQPTGWMTRNSGRQEDRTPLQENMAIALAATPGPWVKATRFNWRRFLSALLGSVVEPILRENDKRADIISSAADEAFRIRFCPGQVLTMIDSLDVAAIWIEQELREKYDGDEYDPQGILGRRIVDVIRNHKGDQR